jgi:lysozyme
MSLPKLRDVSHWQGPVAWKQEKKLVAGVYVNVGQGMGYTDPTAQRRIKNANYAGLGVVGGYLYCVPGVGSPQAQADRLLKLAPLGPGRLRPCMDCEAETSLNNAQLGAWYYAFGLRVLQVTGYRPTVYGSPSYLSRFTTQGDQVAAFFARCPLWVADYGVSRPSIPAPWSAWQAWQWTESFKDPAIGRVDDSFVADLTALRIPVTAKAIRAAVTR